jgi:hypothetical protein
MALAPCASDPAQGDARDGRAVYAKGQVLLGLEVSHGAAAATLELCVRVDALERLAIRTVHKTSLHPPGAMSERLLRLEQDSFGLLALAVPVRSDRVGESVIPLIAPLGAHNLFAPSEILVAAAPAFEPVLGGTGPRRRVRERPESHVVRLAVVEAVLRGVDEFVALVVGVSNVFVTLVEGEGRLEISGVEGVLKAAMFLVDLALLVGLASYGRVDKRIMIGAVARWRRCLAPDEERVAER